MLEKQRGFTILEAMVAIVVTSIVIFGVTGATLGAMHAQANSDAKVVLDDDALAVLSDVRMMTAYDAASIPKLLAKSASMKRTMPSGATETITVSVTLRPATVVNGVNLPAQEVATANASAGSLAASEEIVLYQHAPAPGSTVNQ